MAADLYEFLGNFKVLKGIESSHTSMYSPTGSYYIPFESTDEFFNLYRKEIRKGRTLHITERHKEVGPIVIDLDFRYEKSSAEVRRVYSVKHIEEFLRVYMEKLSNYIEFEQEPKIFVMEKISPAYDETKRVIKDGLHMIISNVVTAPYIQFKIRELVVPELQTIFSSCNFINTSEEIFDEQVIEKNNWLMYGSCKPGGKPYSVTYIYNYGDAGLYLNSEKINDESLVEELSIRNKYNKNMIVESKQGEVNEMRKFAEEDERKKLALKSALQSTHNQTTRICENIDLVRQFVNILSETRAQSYDSWIRVGWCLRNIDNHLLEDWIEFSKKSDKYREGECENLWDRMKDGGLGIKSLYMWAKSDDPEGYENILIKNGRAALEHSMETGLDWDIGQVIKHYYQHFYRCVQIKNELWYHFKGHKWEKCESAYTLRNQMSTKMYEMYSNYLDEWVSKHYPSSSKQELSKIEIYKSKAAIVKSLKSTNYKSKMMKTLADLFHEKAVEEDFHRSLDSKPNLLCFTNGVYDLDECEFREGRPEDCVSLCTNIEYIPYDESDPVYKEINKFLSEVQPNFQKREYIMRTLANSLHGANREEKVYFWTGEGGNGKSKLYSLLENCLGEYAANISVSYITQKRAASNSASPEMVKAIGRRCVVFQEPEDGEKINAGLMKEISGNDSIQVRGLYKEADSFKPQFQVIFICNQLPHLPPDDGGTWRRVRKITFDSKFVQKPNPKHPNEFKIDQDLDRKWPEWKLPFMSLLIHYFVKFKDQPIVEPQEVVDATLEYQKGEDEYADFVETHIERIDPNEHDADEKLNLMQIFNEYKDYCYRWGRTGKEYMKVDGLKRSVARIYGKGQKYRNRHTWTGIRIVPKTADDSDFRAG